MSSRNGTVLWVSLIVACLVSSVFCSAFLIEVTGDSSTTIKDEFGDENLEPSSFDLGNLTIFAETEDINYSADSYDYLFWKNNETYYVKSGKTGEVDVFGVDLSELVETVVCGSTDGLLLVFKSGDYALFSPIEIAEKSDIRIVGAGKELTTFCVESDITAFNVTGNPNTHNLRFELSGCSVDGGAVLSTKPGIF